MIILGLNLGHDASVSLLKDGKVISSISCERIYRLKKTSYIDWVAIDYVLSGSNVSFDEALGVVGELLVPFLVLLRAQQQEVASSALCECGSGAARRRALRGPCLSNQLATCDSLPSRCCARSAHLLNGQPVALRHVSVLQVNPWLAALIGRHGRSMARGTTRPSQPLRAKRPPCYY